MNYRVRGIASSEVDNMRSMMLLPVQCLAIVRGMVIVHSLAFLCVVSCTLAARCTAADYFIDSVSGSDDNDGLSKNKPWKSHGKVESVELAAGDVVHFKKGSAFSGNILISESGTADKPIRLTAYGTGGLPKFTNPTPSDSFGNAIVQEHRIRELLRQANQNMVKFERLIASECLEEWNSDFEEALEQSMTKKSAVGVA